MMVAPAGTPKPIVDRLHREIAAITQLPDIHAQFDKVGYLPPDPTPQEQVDGPDQVGDRAAGAR